MTNPILQQLIATLLLWSIASMGSALCGLAASKNEFWRSFWFMSGLWGLIDGLIAWYALVVAKTPPTALAPILRFNTGLDLVYLATGVILMSRKGLRARAFGLGVLVQGSFLLAFDFIFWTRCVG